MNKQSKDDVIISFSHNKDGEFASNDRQQIGSEWWMGTRTRTKIGRESIEPNQNSTAILIDVVWTETKLYWGNLLQRNWKKLLLIQNWALQVCDFYRINPHENWETNDKPN